MNQHAPARDPYDWLHFVRRSGDEGRRWTKAYRRVRPLEELSTRALLLLRGQRLEEGYALLQRLEEEIRRAERVEPAIRSVLQRWYYGVLGYYFYCLERFDPAERAMEQAHDAVTAAIGERRFLVPLANHCHEFRLHRARIARNRRRWAEVAAHVQAAREMMRGTLPFCTLRDGTPVRISTIREFYAAIPSPTDAERSSLVGLLDDAARLRGFERFVRAMYQVPGFVIPYP